MLNTCKNVTFLYKRHVYLQVSSYSFIIITLFKNCLLLFLMLWKQICQQFGSNFNFVPLKYFLLEPFTTSVFVPANKAENKAVI